jgi:flagellin
MAQIINTNLMSLNAQRNLSNTSSALATSIQRLSTGLRVNSAKDDAAGIAIADRMNAQIRGMNVAIRNANDGISLAQTAEGALGKLGDMAQRMRELAVQSANATNSSSDRDNLDLEYQALGEEIKRTVAGTRFNGVAVLASATAFKFQVGAGGVDQAGAAVTDANEVITATATEMTAKVATFANIKGTDGTAAVAEMKALDTMLSDINTARATWGATQNRFEHAIGNMQVTVENQSAARSRIMDADFAAETASLTRAQVLQQAGTAMLSQANSIPNNVLSLLR